MKRGKEEEREKKGRGQDTGNDQVAHGASRRWSVSRFKKEKEKKVKIR